MTPVTSNYDNLILPLVRALAGNSRRVLTIFITGKTILFDSKNSTVYECYKHIQHIPTAKVIKIMTYKRSITLKTLL